MEPIHGYLRPEGFLRRECYGQRLEDPDYVARLERELLGLVEVAGGVERADQTLSLPEPLRGSARLALDSLAGLSVADALGAAHEGQSYQPQTPAFALPAQRPAPWTDDTQMALSVVEVLLETNGIDPDALARGFARRYEGWRGYGAGMHTLLGRVRSGEDWEAARFTEHGADFAGAEIPESNEDELVLLLVPGPVQEDGVEKP